MIIVLCFLLRENDQMDLNIWVMLNFGDILVD